MSGVNDDYEDVESGDEPVTLEVHDGTLGASSDFTAES